MTPTTIDCIDLAEQLAAGYDATLRILFTSMANAPTSKPDLTRDVVTQYIPGTMLFDFENDFVDTTAEFSNMMPSISEFQLGARKLGLQITDQIVIYDDFGNFCASRAWFMLLSMGFVNVKVLNGGLPSWLGQGYPTQTKMSICEKLSDLQVSPSLEFSFVNADYIKQVLNGYDVGEYPSPVQIIDARGPGRFHGVEPEPRPNMRSGHIPKSVNIHYATLQRNGYFCSMKEIRAAFEQQQIDLSKPIVISCGSGVTACIVAQAAFMLGAQSIRVYDASWSEWGASEIYPIEVSTR